MMTLWIIDFSWRWFENIFPHSDYNDSLVLQSMNGFIFLIDVSKVDWNSLPKCPEEAIFLYEYQQSFFNAV